MSAIPLDTGFGAFSDDDSVDFSGPQPGPVQVTSPTSHALLAPSAQVNDVSPGDIVDLSHVQYEPSPERYQPVPVGFADDSAAVTSSVPLENGHTLGLALLLVSAGTAVGLSYGGMFGGVAGGLYGGSVINAIRAARCVTHGTAQSDHEALVSGTYAVACAGLATYLLYRTRTKQNPDSAIVRTEAEKRKDV